MSSRLVQYIVINGRILDLGWNKGAVIAQACHAATAVMMSNREDPEVLEYCSPANLPLMTKIVLKASSEEFDALCESLKSESVLHWTWLEEPDKICSAIAFKPTEKSRIQHLVQHLKLYR